MTELFGGLSDDWRNEVATWSRNHGLASLAMKLRSHTDETTFLDFCAEAVVARYLLAQGCDLVADVETPAGSTCDLEMVKDDRTMYLHIKRADIDRPLERKITISSRLRYLEQIARPYVVAVRWVGKLDDAEMRELVQRASEFIQQAHVGDELVVHDDDGRELGGVLIVAPWEGTHVSLTIGLSSGFTDYSPRFLRLLRRGYKQFMPRAVNVVVIASGSVEDVDDFDMALLGSHVERWDRHPPRGRRIAHGRAADGFWAANRNLDSQAAVWVDFDMETARLRTRLWVRSPVVLEGEDVGVLTELFGGME